MRTTLTLDDDLAGLLQTKAQAEGTSLKSVVNELLRAGLTAHGDVTARREPIRVIAKPLRLKPGYDPDKLNQLVDELEVEEYRRKESPR